jgi:hypothetical protein
MHKPLAGHDVGSSEATVTTAAPDGTCEQARRNPSMNGISVAIQDLSSDYESKDN